jgi:cyclopropane fatty-acyl-phospholipid synthase-like methyltransferase
MQMAGPSSSNPDRGSRPHEVARYYDRNTARFLAIGDGARSHAIHRALWGAGVSDAEAATSYINQLIGDAIESLGIKANSTFLDLGCGVGGTLFALAERFPESRLHGVTISSRQASLAMDLAERRGLAARCEVRCGDFESIDLGMTADVAFAVESMAHARSPGRFLAGAARHLAQHGTLIVVDDFIVADESPTGGALAVLDDFRQGWRLSSLTTVPAFVAAAASMGFELAESRDLTPLIRLGRPRDRIIAAVAPLLRWLVQVPMFGNLVGGAALTRGLGNGVLGYYWLRFRT